MKDFIIKALSTPSGSPSSKRLLSIISTVFFMGVFVWILIYFMTRSDQQIITSVERNLHVILLFAGSVSLIPQGLSSLEKFKKDE